MAVFLLPTLMEFELVLIVSLGISFGTFLLRDYRYMNRIYTPAGTPDVVLWLKPHNTAVKNHPDLLCT